MPNTYFVDLVNGHGKIGDTTNSSRLYTIGAANTLNRLCVGSDNYVYVTDTQGYVWRIKPPLGLNVARFPITGTPWGICSDGTNIWVTDSTTGHGVWKLNVSTGATTNYTQSGAALYGICYGPDGYLYAADSVSGNGVWKINPADGTFTQIALSGASCYGTCSDGTNIWVADSAGAAVWKVTTGGATTKYSQTGSAPRQVVYDGTSIWMADATSGNGFWKINTGTGSGTKYACSGATLSDICWDGSNLWATDSTSAKAIWKCTQAGTTTNYPYSGFTSKGICWHSDDGNLWVAESTNKYVWQVSSATRDGLSYANRVNASTLINNAGASDIIKLAKTADSYQSSTTGNFVVGQDYFTLGQALNSTLYTDGAWTSGNAHVTCTAATSSPTPFQGANWAKNAIDSTGANGLLAYYAFSAKDLSAYRQISFVIQASAITAANSIAICLCSDNAGATPVNTFIIPWSLLASNNHKFTLDNLSALGSSIQSIALYALKTITSTSFSIDDVNACYAPSSTSCLTLNSLIGTGDGIWYAVRTISGTTVYLETGPISGSYTAKWWGSAGVQNLYIKQPLLYPKTTYSILIQNSSSGTSGGHISFSGGWDTADSMGTRNGDTCLDGTVDSAILASFSNVSYTDYSYLSLVRGGSLNPVAGTGVKFTYCSEISQGAGQMFTFGGANVEYSHCVFNGCNYTGGAQGYCGGPNGVFDNNTVLNAGYASSIGYAIAVNNSYYAAALRPAPLKFKSVSNNTFYGCSPGLFVNADVQTMTGNITSYGDSNFGATSSTGAALSIGASVKNLTVQNHTASNNTYAAYSMNGNAKFINCTGNTNGTLMQSDNWNNSCFVNLTQSGNTAVYSQLNTYGGYISRLKSQKENGSVTGTIIRCSCGTITQDTNQHNQGTWSWKFAVSALLSANADNGTTVVPWSLDPIPVPVTANVQATVTVKIRQDSGNLVARIRALGGYLAGVDNDVIANADTGTLNSWQTISISFTPTESGYIPIMLELASWSSTSINAWFDGPFLVTQ